jgi:5,10-methylenetetrahydromethanopterin reductase
VEGVVRVSIAELGEMPHDRFVEFVKLCELLRYDGFFHADEKWTRDVWTRLGIAAAVTSRIRLGTSVTDAVTRHAALEGQAAATLAEATKGRLTLGFGAGSHFETLPGYEVVRPAVAIREAIEIMRGLWRGERVQYTGQVISVHGAKLDFPLDPAYVPPVWVATRGAQTLRMAGAVADGVLVGSFATKMGIDWAKSEIQKGLDRSSRTWDDITLASWLYVCILEHEDDPIPEGIRRGVSHAMWSSRSVVFPLLEKVTDDLPAEFVEFLRKAPERWSPDVMAELRRMIPRDVLDSLSVVGTAEQVVQRLKDLEEMGVQEVVMWPFPANAKVVSTAGGGDIEDFVIRFADQVMPEVRRHESRGGYQLVD